MNHNLLKIMCMSVIVFMTMPVFSHPVIWKGGTAFMTAMDADMSHYQSMYSFSPRGSVGIEFMPWHERNDGALMAVNNWLINRWNGPHYQGNIYASFSAGMLTESDNFLGRVMLQGDWETRRVYTESKVTWIGSDDSQLMVRGRIGIAPYIGDYDALHTWLILQLDDVFDQASHDTTVIPVVRLFKDNVLVELGTNFSDRVFSSVMIHI